MIPQWIIEKKRDGGTLSGEEIAFMVNGYTRGDLPDYQMAALAMAIYFQGMQFEETTRLTETMLHTGEVLDTSGLNGPVADKHSTGGIGDKVSLLLAPLVACCGLQVPMISGRGLGITGGTLDKLETIPGYRTDLSTETFLDVLADCGCSIIGQTAEIAPADRKLYALRDVTATVPSIPLIVASIMSKKLAEGLDALVLDVKWGTGAFMKSYEDARELARNLVEVGHRMGKRTAALLTDMNQPLGRTAGNALEIKETLAGLRGGGPPDLMEVTLALGEHMLEQAGLADRNAGARALLEGHLASGAALDRFFRMAELHGADPDTFEDQLAQAALIHPLAADRSGVVTRVDADTVGRACLVLGAGRTRTDEAIDPAVGVSELVRIGDEIQAGDLLAELHASDEVRLAEAMTLMKEAIHIQAEPDGPPPVLLREVIRPEGASA